MVVLTNFLRTNPTVSSCCAVLVGPNLIGFDWATGLGIKIGSK